MWEYGRERGGASVVSFPRNNRGMHAVIPSSGTEWTGEATMKLRVAEREGCPTPFFCLPYDERRATNLFALILIRVPVVNVLPKGTEG